MTYRDAPLERPPCPVCGLPDNVQTHDNPYQGRWLAACHMVLFNDTSAEYVRPERRREDITDGLEAARAALEQTREAESSGP